MRKFPYADTYFKLLVNKKCYIEFSNNTYKKDIANE